MAYFNMPCYHVADHNQQDQAQVQRQCNVKRAIKEKIKKMPQEVDSNDIHFRIVQYLFGENQDILEEEEKISEDYPEIQPVILVPEKYGRDVKMVEEIRQEYEACYMVQPFKVWRNVPDESVDADKGEDKDRIVECAQLELSQEVPCF